jgi:pilus assembly protein FimV
LKHPAFWRFFPIFLCIWANTASAIGLGEVRNRPVLGEKLNLQIELVGGANERIDAGCFHLQKPASGDLPWLRKASFRIVPSQPRVLELRSDQPVRDPVLQIALQIACGHDVLREYVVLALPPREFKTAEPKYVPESMSTVPGAAMQRESVVPRPPRPAEQVMPARPASQTVRPSLPRPQATLERVSSSGPVGDPILRLATELGAMAVGRAMSEDQRDILRLEFRVLLALNEQATTQLSTSERLRELETALTELQKRNVAVAEKQSQALAPAAPVEKAPVAPVPAQPATPAPPTGDDGSFGALLSGLIAALVGALGWLGWRYFNGRRQQSAAMTEADYPAPQPRMDPRRVDEVEAAIRAEPPPVAPVVASPSSEFGEKAPRRELPVLDMDLGQAPPVNAPMLHPADSMMSVSAATLDEHFEANPVMELADIMLSFGRVKGAAQALQEYIDQNPQEALQPWIRLMDVYRMAGMREEFEMMARNLNQHFNVEILEWEQPATSEGGAPVLDIVLDGDASKKTLAKPQSIEDMPRVMQNILDWWPHPDAAENLHQLLRDNGGGKRLGFALPVVEEILFLIGIKEAVNKAETENARH